MPAFLSEGQQLFTNRIVRLNVFNTSFDDIYADIVNASVNLLFHKLWRCMMDACDACSILCGQGRRGSHGVAAMSRNDFLICFEAATYVYIRIIQASEQEVFLTLRRNSLSRL